MKKLLLTITFLLITTLSFAGTFIENRNNKTFFIGGSQGLYLPTLITTPIQLGVWANENFYIGAEHGSYEFQAEEGGIESLTGKYENKGIIFRYFATKGYAFESFNVYSAYHIRRLDVNTTIKIDHTKGPLEDETQTHSKAIIESQVLALGFGNMWIFDNGISLGLDYFYAPLLLKETIESSVTLNSEASNIKYADELKVMNDRFAELGKNINKISYYPGVFIITMGWSF